MKIEILNRIATMSRSGWARIRLLCLQLLRIPELAENIEEFIVAEDNIVEEVQILLCMLLHRR